jgi:exosome complex component RRP41
LDGRRAHELRSVNGAMGVISGRLSEGSSFFEIGNTRVMATVFGPREISGDGDSSASNINMKSPLSISGVDSDEKGSVSVKIHAASFSSTGGERRKNTRQDR